MDSDREVNKKSAFAHTRQRCRRRCALRNAYWTTAGTAKAKAQGTAIEPICRRIAPSLTTRPQHDGIGSMKRPALLLCSALLLAHASLCMGQPGGFQRLTIPDNNGYERPIPAFTVDVPAGWQGQGAVFWDGNTQCAQTVPSMHWQARSPDGQQVFELLPRWASQMSDPRLGSSMPGCPSMPITSIRGYLEYLARQRHPAARMLDYRDRPDVSSKTQAPPSMSVPGSPIQNRSWVEAGELLIAWSENGREMRESLMASGVFVEMRADMPMLGATRSLTLHTGAASAFRAPDGQLDLALFDRMRSSLQADANWQARMNKHQADMSQIALKGVRERGEIAARGHAETMRNRNEAWEIQQRGWEDRENSRDIARRNHINGIREVQPHHDPHTGNTVELSNHYDHSWRLNDGTYYQTNDPNFNPYLELGIDGTELAPVEQ